jgi:hypothetical protein
VSKSTFFAHRRQERLDGYNGSDADDDDSDTEPDESAGRISPPLAPFAAPNTPDAEGGIPSPVPRAQRTASPAGSLPESDMSEHEPVTGDVEDQQDRSTTTPESAGGVSPPPLSESRTPGDSPDFDDIQEAIFSNFDIEDLLYAAHIEVEPWLKLGIVLLRWKSRKNISTHAYNELRNELAKCLGIKVPSD